MGKLMGVEQLFEGRHFDREVIIQAEPARPGGDDGRTRPVAGPYDHYALGVAIPEFEKRRRQSNSIRRRVARHARSQATIYAARVRHSVNAIERLSL
jgi:hypothetical protein